MQNLANQQCCSMKPLQVISSILLSLIIAASCKTDSQGNSTFCSQAVVTKRIGWHRLQGLDNDLKLLCNITDKNGQTFKGELIIEVPLFGESYTPFKVGDQVLVKYKDPLVAGSVKNISVMYFLESPADADGYKRIAPYSFEQACKSDFPKDFDFRTYRSFGTED